MVRNMKVTTDARGAVATVAIPVDVARRLLALAYEDKDRAMDATFYRTPARAIAETAANELIGALRTALDTVDRDPTVPTVPVTTPNNS